MKIRNYKNYRINSLGILKMLEENKLSVKEFAEGIGLPEQTARSIVSGSIRQPKLSTVINICNYLNCSSDYILGLSNRPHHIG